MRALATKEYNQFKNELLGQIQHFAPNGIEYQKVVDNFIKLEKHGSDNVNNYMTLLYILMDGMKYGNWPWNNPNRINK